MHRDGDGGGAAGARRVEQRIVRALPRAIARETRWRIETVCFGSPELAEMRWPSSWRKEAKAVLEKASVQVASHTRHLPSQRGRR